MAGVIPAAIRKAWPVRAELGVLKYAGIIFLASGFIVFLTSVLRFLFEGGGTPAIWFTRSVRWLIGEEPGRLVLGGLYRYTRNPMYLGAVCIFLGEATLLESAAIFAYAAAMWLFFHVMVVYGEERHLKKKFGESYEEYCRSTPQWIGFRSR